MQDTPVTQNKKPARATLADIDALPPNMVGEILFGVLYAQNRPGPHHARAATRLLTNIEVPFDQGRGGPGGWVILYEPELHLGEHVVVPDIAGWRVENMRRLPDKAYFETPPDWIAEVLSLSTRRTDRTDKIKIYSEYRVSHVWYVDPSIRILEVMTLVGNHYQLTATFVDADEICAPPFDVHTFKLDVLWPDAVPPERDQ